MAPFAQSELFDSRRLGWTVRPSSVHFWTIPVQPWPSILPFWAALITFVLPAGTNRSIKASYCSRGAARGNALMVAREYLLKQAMTLFRLAKAVKDPTLSAGLLSKAADLEDKANQTASSPLFTPALKEPPAG